MKTIQKKSPAVKKILNEYAKLYRQYRIALQTDYDLDVAVLYGTQDMYNRHKHLPVNDQIIMMHAEISWLKQDTEDLNSKKVALIC